MDTRVHLIAGRFRDLLSAILVVKPEMLALTEIRGNLDLPAVMVQCVSSWP